MKLILSINPKDLDTMLLNNMDSVKSYKGGFLFSYLAIRDKIDEIIPKIQAIRNVNPNVVFMLDSGAHSFIYIFAKKIKKVQLEMGHGLNVQAIEIMKNTGMDKFVKTYSMFMYKYKDIFDIFVELDLQGIYGVNTVESWRQLFVESCGDKLMVVWHGEPEVILTEWCNKYKYVGLGGTKASKEEQGRTKSFIKETVQKYPDNRFHLFALTDNNNAMYSSMGLYSADSTSWSLGSRFGLMYYFDEASKKLISQGKYFLRRDNIRSDTINFLAWIKFGNFLADLGKFKGDDK